MPPRKGKQLKGGTSQVPVRVQPPKDSSSDEALNVDIPGQPGPHPPFVPSSSSPAECQDQSKLCIALSLEMKKYCKLKYSRCNLHDSSQTLNTLLVFPRFVRKASSLSTSLPPCPSPCTDLSCGDPHAVPRGSRLCPRTLQGLSANIPSHGRGINAPPTSFGARRERCAEMAIFASAPFRILSAL